MLYFIAYLEALDITFKSFAAMLYPVVVKSEWCGKTELVRLEVIHLLVTTFLLALGQGSHNKYVEIFFN